MWRQAFGPTFLVYYSPAFVRSLAPLDAFAALQILAEVYRRARVLWPLRATTDNAHSVTIRIDQLKERKLASILDAHSEGRFWILDRKNDTEAVVESVQVDQLSRTLSHDCTQVLKFHKLYRSVAARGTDRSVKSSGTSKASEKSSEKSSNSNRSSSHQGSRVSGAAINKIKKANVKFTEPPMAVPGFGSSTPLGGWISELRGGALGREPEQAPTQAPPLGPLEV